MMQDRLIKITENTSIMVDSDTRFILDIPEFSSGSVYTLHLVFEKEGVNAEIVGAFSLKNGDSLKLTTISEHKVPNTSCTAKVKRVLEEGASSEYTGNIVIAKEAHQTSSFLEDRVLVLGEKVVNRSSPNLKIDANDVKASHGATTGRVSEDELFYLMSRGLSKKEAESLIVEGFFNEVLSAISDDRIKEELYERLSYSK
jgi:Fe-S cluster assembly protein SufD